MTATSAVTLRLIEQLFPNPKAIHDLVAKGHTVVIIGKDVRKLVDKIANEYEAIPDASHKPVDRITNPYETIPDASHKLRLFLLIVPGLAYANITRELDHTSSDMLTNMGVSLGKVADEYTDE
jgi:hypothetical protein